MAVSSCNHLVSDPSFYCELCSDVLCKKCIRVHPAKHDSSTVSIEEYVRKETAHFQKELEHIVHFKKEIGLLDTRSNDLQVLVDTVRQKFIKSTQSFDDVQEKLFEWKEKTVKGLKERKEEESRLAAGLHDSESGCFQKPLVLHRGSISIADISRKLAPVFIAERLTARARSNSQPTVNRDLVHPMHFHPSLTSFHSCPSPESSEFQGGGGDQYGNAAHKQLPSDDRQTATVDEDITIEECYINVKEMYEDFHQENSSSDHGTDPSTPTLQKDDHQQMKSVTGVYSNILTIATDQQRRQNDVPQVNHPVVQPLNPVNDPRPTIPQRNQPSMQKSGEVQQDDALNKPPDLANCNSSLTDGYQKINGAATCTVTEQPLESTYFTVLREGNTNGQKIAGLPLAPNISYGAVSLSSTMDSEPIYDFVANPDNSGSTKMQGSVTLTEQAQRLEELGSSTHLWTEQGMSSNYPLRHSHSPFLLPFNYDTVISNRYTEGVTFSDVCTNLNGYIIAANLAKSCLEIFDRNNYCGKIDVNGSPAAVVFREAHSKSNSSSVLVAGNFKNCSILKMKITEKFKVEKTKTLKFLTGVPLAIAVSNECIKSKSNQSCFFMATRQIKSGMTNTEIKCLKCNGNSNSTFSSDIMNPVAIGYQDGYLVVCDGEEGCLVKISTANGKPVWDEGVDARQRGIVKKPRGIAMLLGGHIAVSDSEAHSVKIFTEDGALKQIIGKEGGNIGEFRRPTALAIRNFNELVIVDSLNYRIQILNMDHLLNTDTVNAAKKCDEESLYSEV